MASLKTLFTASLISSVLIAGNAFAGTFDDASQNMDYLSINGGEYNALRGNGAAQYGVEYRFAQVGYGIHPIIGGFGNSDGSAYGYGGINWEVPILPNQLYLIPNFSVGAWHQGDNNNKELGGAIEFRSGIEMDYQFPNNDQLGIALNHISNAGIYNKNPGEETIMGTLSLPISQIRGWIGR